MTISKKRREQIACILELVACAVIGLTAAIVFPAVIFGLW